MKNNNSPNIALIGNMNNNFSALALYLIDLGFEIKLLLFDGDYFHPKDDMIGEQWKVYTKRLTWGSLDTFKDKYFDAVKEDLKEFHFFIGCGNAPAFLSKVGINLDIFIPYGSDLYFSPFFRIVHPKRFFKMLQISKHQRLGIKKSNRVFMAPTGGKLENYLTKIGVSLNKVFKGGVPMIYHKQIYSTLFNNFTKELEICNEIKHLKSKGKYIIFHNSRHQWLNAKDPVCRETNGNCKGNNYLFEGLKLIIEFDNDLKDKYHVITYEYGPDVENSKKLISDLGLESNVTWVKKSPRIEVLAALKYSDIVIGELALSYYTYGVIYEAMALKKIIMHKRIKEDYKKIYPKQYPMLYADSPDSVAKGLKRIADKGIENIKIGEIAHQWYQKHLIEEPINEIVKLINEK